MLCIYHSKSQTYTTFIWVCHSKLIGRLYKQECLLSGYTTSHPRRCWLSHLHGCILPWWDFAAILTHPCKVFHTTVPMTAKTRGSFSLWAIRVGALACLLAGYENLSKSLSLVFLFPIHEKGTIVLDSLSYRAALRIRSDHLHKGGEV